MKANILATAAGLSDRDLLARLERLAGRERDACVDLVAHLAALDSRPALYAAEGSRSSGRRPSCVQLGLSVPGRINPSRNPITSRATRAGAPTRAPAAACFSSSSSS